MIDISSHPLLQQAYGVCQAIEQCGASPELTRAVGRASDLFRSLDDHLKRDNGTMAGEQVSTVTPIQGEAMSFMLDPLEQAIESTARVLRDEHEHLAQTSMTVSRAVSLSPVYKRMSAHLEALLSAQLKRVGDDRHQ